MSEYEPGTVAVATVRGIKGVRAFRMPGAEWVTAEIIGGCRWHNDSDVTDARPLVALDPSEVEWPFVATDANGLRAYANQVGSRFFAAQLLIEQIADQIDQQTKPPRIPEPGLWGVVDAQTNFPTRRWVHHEEGRWISDMGTVLHWEDLRNPVLVREGISE